MNIRDIAQIANVSVTTVSRVLNNNPRGVGAKTRERVLKVIEEYNFSPSVMARGMITKQTKALGLLIPDITDPYFAWLFRGVEDYARTQEYNVFVCNTDWNVEKELKYIKMLSEKGVDGFIFGATSCDLREFTENVKIDKPLVSLDRRLKELNIGGISIDHSRAGYLAASYLLAKGHRHILFIGNGREDSATVDRLDGFKYAHGQIRMPYRENMVFLRKKNDNVCKRAINKLLQSPEITACICSGDTVALEMRKALLENQMDIPGTISLIHMGSDIVSSNLVQELTSVHEPVYQAGYDLAALLFQAMNEPQKRQQSLPLILPEFKEGFTVKNLSGGSGKP